MAAAVAPVSSSSWFPQDDLLLKNAIEAGASLESLAKGAVEFSRRFTFEELKNRWYNLLYDPIVSLDAASQMTMFENSSPVGGLKASNGAKRKSESVRNCYYAMRKRIRHDPFTTGDSGDYVISPINSNGCLGYSDDAFGADDFGLDDSNCELIQSFLEPGLLNSSPVEDVYVHRDTIEEQIPHIRGDNTCFDRIHYSTNVEFSQPKVIPIIDPFETFDPDDIVDDPIFGVNSEISEGLHYCSTLPEQQYFSSLPEMDLQEGGELRNQVAFGFPDCANSSELHIPSSPINNVILKELSNSLMNPSSEDDLFLMDIDGKDTIEKEYIDRLSSLLFNTPNENVPNSETIEAASEIHQSLASGWESSLISSLIIPADAQSPPDELREGTVLCVLNTEDTEVPCNDDVFLLYQMTPPAFSYSLEMERNESRNPGPSIFNDFQAREENVERMVPQMVNSPSKSSGENKDAIIEIPQAEKPAEVVDDIVIINNNHEDVFTAIVHETDQTQHPQPPAQGLPVNQLEVNDEEIPLESDDEIPDFSDIEEMILNMDLSPEDKDSHPVLGYQDDDDDSSKRDVMRLEQAAMSYMHRAIAYKDALAVLYGRHIKYFIRKREVLLGRTTTDHCRVDIDLSKEGKASKISRRQAIIRMDEDGSFTMKNLGNGQVFVNGKQVAPKQTANLPSNCLIDVRGMSFIFETIDRVRQRSGNC
ncbi:uncharacterized protein LOC124946069 [Impatiens glandulifera]|uniref:uncharacterized protein LOC124946069 n=1 Tax=Impatiens glandulifera TaxID=253017 RepID=UPI001FB0DF1D|nr:uncharacterized protein LOC124946069 [Impatiens glandulifera]